MVFQAQGKLNEALNNFRIASEIDPKFAKSYFNIGVVFHDQGKL